MTKNKSCEGSSKLRVVGPEEEWTPIESLFFQFACLAIEICTGWSHEFPFSSKRLYSLVFIAFLLPRNPRAFDVSDLSAKITEW